MRKINLALASALLLVLLLCSCAAATTPVYQGDETSYRPEGQMDYIKQTMEGDASLVHALDPFNGYYILQDVFSFGGRTLTGVTIPVYRTKQAVKGNFTFTIAKFKVVENNLKLVQGSEVEILVNAKQYGLEANYVGVCSFIDVDISSYGIVLAEDETIGFSAPTDTLCLFCINSTETDILATIAADAPNSLGYFKKGGATYLTDTIPIDFRWATSELDAQKAAEELYYENLISQLREKYQGKRISIIGDSISTFGGITNVSSYNSTMVNNAVYYKKTEKMPSWQCTYWGRLASDLGMELCAMNAWSGSRVYGNDSYNFEDARVIAPKYLYNENGTPKDPSDDIYPDLITVYIGINDFNKFGLTKCTEVDALVKEAAGDKEKLTALLDEWFAKVLEKSDDGETLVHDVNYSQFDEAYALMLYRLLKYNPDAEILVMGLMGNGRTAYSDGKMQWYINTMRTLCEYFGIEFLDWGAELDIDRDTARFYNMDVEVNVLHPNVNGHRLMEREILKALAD